MAYLPEEVRPNGENHFDLLCRCRTLKLGDREEHTRALNRLPETVENATGLMYHIGYIFPAEAEGFIDDLLVRGDGWCQQIGLTRQMLGFWVARLRDGVRDGIRDGHYVHPMPPAAPSPVVQGRAP